MENMDWGEVFEFVSFGNVGSDHLDDSAYYVIVAPQNVVGSTIMTKLLEMVRIFISCVSIKKPQELCVARLAFPAGDGSSDQHGGFLHAAQKCMGRRRHTY